VLEATRTHLELYRTAMEERGLARDHRSARAEQAIWVDRGGRRSDLRRAARSGHRLPRPNGYRQKVQNCLLASRPGVLPPKNSRRGSQPEEESALVGVSAGSAGLAPVAHRAEAAVRKPLGELITLCPWRETKAGGISLENDGLLGVAVPTVGRKPATLQMTIALAKPLAASASTLAATTLSARSCQDSSLSRSPF
jgi:hypothetical protein